MHPLPQSSFHHVIASSVFQSQTIVPEQRSPGLVYLLQTRVSFQGYQVHSHWIAQETEAQSQTQTRPLLTWHMPASDLGVFENRECLAYCLEAALLDSGQLPVAHEYRVCRVLSRACAFTSSFEAHWFFSAHFKTSVPPESWQGLGFTMVVFASAETSHSLDSFSEDGGRWLRKLDCIPGLPEGP